MKKLVATVFLTLTVLAGASAGGDKASPLEGTWIVTGAIFGGKAVPEEAFAKAMATLVIKDGKYTMFRGDKEYGSYMYKIDVACNSKPATLDPDRHRHVPARDLQD